MAGVQELLQLPADLSLCWSPAGATEPRPSKPSPLPVWPRLRHSPGTETCPWMNTRAESSPLAIQKRVRRGGWSLLWEPLARPKREPFSPGPPRQPAAPQLAQGSQVGAQWPSKRGGHHRGSSLLFSGPVRPTPRALSGWAEREEVFSPFWVLQGIHWGEGENTKVYTVISSFHLWNNEHFEVQREVSVNCLVSARGAGTVIRQFHN